ncbi:MAG: endonuclease III [Polyangiaceae bacterium]
MARKSRPGAPVSEMFRLLVAEHPDAHCELEHASAFELVVATVLSAQATDVAVNKVTPELFRRWPDAPALAAADPAEVERVIGSLGFFRQKTKSIVGLARGLMERHGGQVPKTLDELVKLPGVGRKTANVVLGVAFGTPEGVVVDTHVLRLSQRLGWSRHDTPEKVEEDLMAALPRADWDRVSHTLIFHGRRVCSARKPACTLCSVRTLCPSAFQAEKVGRKPPRLRTDRSAKKLAKKPAKKAGRKASAAKPAKAAAPRKPKPAAKAAKTKRAAKAARRR